MSAFQCSLKYFLKSFDDKFFNPFTISLPSPLCHIEHIPNDFLSKKCYYYERLFEAVFFLDATFKYYQYLKYCETNIEFGFADVRKINKEDQILM